MKEELSTCEAPIMKIIWETNSDISIPELTGQLAARFGKEYARTTVVTFLHRLAAKGYVSTCRKGRLAYVHAEKDVNDYKRMIAKKDTDFWFNGSLSEFIQSLSEVAPLTKEEIEKVRQLLDQMEENA